MVEEGGFSIERGKSICAKRQRAEGGNNLVTSQYVNSRTWWEMEDGGISDKKLLVARRDERCGKVCGGV